MEIFIETERLILRHWKEEDRKPFAVMTGNPNVMKYFPSTLSTEESSAFVDRINSEFEETGYGLYAVETKDTGEFIGYVGFTEKSTVQCCTERKQMFHAEHASRFC